MAVEIERRLVRQMSRLNRRFGLLEEGDRVMVCLSGGKDSWSMLRLLDRYRRILPFDYELFGVNLDQGQPGFEQSVIRDYCKANGYPVHLVHEDTYSVVKANVPEGKTYCSLCSRLRRGILYRVAGELGATKIALGHHRDDAIETLILNLFWSGQMKSMPPRLTSDDGKNTIVRPLAWCSEREISEYADAERFPILPCNLCGTQAGGKRARVKRLLAELELEVPNLRKNLMASLGNVKPSHLYDLNLNSGAAETEAGDFVTRTRLTTLRA
jgi:tRNA 2-thiocytidine biosynthesis protein TtcA